MKPLKFASSRTHKRLYEAYDSNPSYWKAALWDFFVNRQCEFYRVNAQVDEAPEDFITETAANLATDIDKATIPFDLETCDYWVFKRMSKLLLHQARLLSMDEPSQSGVTRGDASTGLVPHC